VRVFLDTNVLIGGFVTRGLCADVIRLVLAEHELIVGEVVLEETKRILKQKIHLPEPLAADVLAFLESQTIQAKPKETPSIRIRDEDDLMVLATALAAKADVLITGDKDLLEISDRVPDMLITDPRGFWGLVQKQPKKK
jgi:putative PIN family toxin of toxin-antitoxin system